MVCDPLATSRVRDLASMVLMQSSILRQSGMMMIPWDWLGCVGTQSAMLSSLSPSRCTLVGDIEEALALKFTRLMLLVKVNGVFDPIGLVTLITA